MFLQNLDLPLSLREFVRVLQRTLGLFAKLTGSTEPRCSTRRRCRCR